MDRKKKEKTAVGNTYNLTYRGKEIARKTPKKGKKVPTGGKMSPIASISGSTRCKGTPSTGGKKNPH